MRENVRTLKPFLFLFIVALVYLPVLDYELVWDDTLFLVESPLYRNPAFWTQALSQPFILSANYFRPVVLITYMLELSTFGPNPVVLHATNLLLHLLNTVLVAILARRLLSVAVEAHKRWFPIVGAVVFALHPALIEGVAFVSSRFDLLMTTFLLGGLLADSLVRRPVRRSLAVGTLFLLALLSKESAVTFVIVLPLWRMAVQATSRRPEGSLWRRFSASGPVHTYLVMGVAGGLYVVLRYLALGYLWQARVGPIVETGDILQHLLLVSRSILGYLSLTIWPFTNLSPIHYATLPIAKSNLVAWAALITLLFLVVGLVKLIRSRPRSGWLALAALLALLPVINIVPLQLGGGAFIAERYLLFPIALLALAVIVVAERAWTAWPEAEYKWIVPAAWLLLSVGTIQLTLPFWENEMSLWTWGANRAPLSALPRTNLALVYLNQGSYERALAEADRAVNMDSASSDSWNHLGIALFQLGDYENAQEALEKAVELAPQNALAWSNLAATLREQEQVEEAIEMLVEQALPLNPSSFAIHYNLALTYLYADRPDLAVPHFQEALFLAPPGGEETLSPHLAYLEEPEPWLSLGNNLLANGAPEEALPAYEQAEALGAQPIDVSVGVSASLIELERFSEAENLLEEALEIAPNDPRLYNNLGMLNEKQHNLEAAAEYFNQAIALAPDWEIPQQNLQRVQE